MPGASESLSYTDSLWDVQRKMASAPNRDASGGVDRQPSRCSREFDGARQEGHCGMPRCNRSLPAPAWPRAHRTRTVPDPLHVLTLDECDGSALSMAAPRGTRTWLT